MDLVTDTEQIRISLYLHCHLFFVSEFVRMMSRWIWRRNWSICNTQHDLWPWTEALNPFNSCFYIQWSIKIYILLSSFMKAHVIKLNCNTVIYNQRKKNWSYKYIYATIFINYLFMCFYVKFLLVIWMIDTCFIWSDEWFIGNAASWWGFK